MSILLVVERELSEKIKVAERPWVNRVYTSKFEPSHRTITSVWSISESPLILQSWGAFAHTCPPAACRTIHCSDTLPCSIHLAHLRLPQLGVCLIVLCAEQGWGYSSCELMAISESRLGFPIMPGGKASTVEVTDCHESWKHWENGEVIQEQLAAELWAPADLYVSIFKFTGDR